MECWGRMDFFPIGFTHSEIVRLAEQWHQEQLEESSNKRKPVYIAESLHDPDSLSHIY